MISIIICHRNANYLNTFKQNVFNTIGVPYEIIVVDNSKNKYSIFQAYNIGFCKSIFEIICFVHEDVLFHTQDWGKKVVEYFSNPKVGLIGILGSHYLPALPGSWGSTKIISGTIIQGINDKLKKSNLRYHANSESSLPAVLLDGVWLCVSRTAMENVNFDEKTFRGFHCYDSDICLQIKKQHFEIRVIFDIILEHFSTGNKNSLWVKDTFRLFKKWKQYLPISTIELTKSEIQIAYQQNIVELIELIKKNNLCFLYTLKLGYYYSLANPLCFKEFPFCNSFFSFFSIYFRYKIKNKYSEISIENPLKNSIKYIIKKALNYVTKIIKEKE